MKQIVTNFQLFDKNLVALDLEAEDSTQVIRSLGSLMQQNGYITGEYIDAVIAREQEFATGLPTKPYAIAIPHADPEHVLKTGVAIGILSSPTLFGAMGDPASTLPVTLVFLLAVKEPQKQVGMLQGLIQLFRKSEIIESLCAKQDSEEVIQTIQSEIHSSIP